jgi:hypothetical protein
MRHERAAFKIAEKTGAWNNALIHTPKGDYHLRIPTSLASPVYFRRMVAAKKSPDKIALVFNLLFVNDLMLSKFEQGRYIATNQQERMYVNSLGPENLEMTVIGPVRQLRKSRQQKPTF